MLNDRQLLVMLNLQDSMNKKVNPAWLDAGYAYLRAAMIESVEAIEHHGWKWWKAQTLDLAQVQMELVDIWHFALSDIIITHKGDLNKAAAVISKELKTQPSQIIFDSQTIEFDRYCLVENLELMAGLCVAKRFSVPLFIKIVEQADMNSQMLFEQYVGKNVLNFFRQDHGYKDGTYHKLWHGREDNEHLVEVLALLDPSSEDYSELVYRGLAQRYPS